MPQAPWRNALIAEPVRLRPHQICTTPASVAATGSGSIAPFQAIVTIDASSGAVSRAARITGHQSGPATVSLDGIGRAAS